ncbi:MAG TPA: nitroreductase family protein [Candidatus Syntrophosphaera sp.]|jgi:nitroreductase|nr:nitroreductase family protein [Candidatus Syntrophosphaera sp.]
MKPKPQFDHPISELLQKRWSPRAFAETQLTEEQALTLFEAARWAASCNNDQPWRFIWSLRDGSERYQRLLDCLTSRNREWGEAAPLLILTLTRTTFAETGKPNAWCRHDLGLAIGNLTAQASSMDLYVHNMGGFSADKTREFFAIPDDIEPVTMIAVGYLGDPSSLSEFNQKRELEVQTRKPLSELFL